MILTLQAAHDPVAAEAVLSAGDIAWRIGLALTLVLANGFFVAAEFALVGARRTRIEALVRAGSRPAIIARNAINRLDHYLSATQLGITLASLGLGWVGENTLAAIFIQTFGGLGAPWDVVASHLVAGTIAFSIITVLHIVLGELMPKSIAIMKPETTSLWTAPLLVAFAKVLTPFIWLLNGLANKLLGLFGLKAPHESERVHRPEEIDMIVKQSSAHGQLGEEPGEMIRGVIELSQTTAGEVMTPRIDLVALPKTASVQEAAEIILREGHSRVPVFSDTIDNVTGVLLARDVWNAQVHGETDLAAVMRPVNFVPDSKPIIELLPQMQKLGVQLVVVVDEFGGTAGILTIEDLVEEIVGEIRDEHDVEPPGIDIAPDGRVFLIGGLGIGDLNDEFDLDLPEEDYTTVAGYVMGRLGRIA
ncbi:MAG TPA: hemolysin family protein, partial [Longimicrobiales bacterium]|nr:hemolysin family protein [Longimicrobiales bacterium]